MANKISHLLNLSDVDFLEYQRNSRIIAVGKLSKESFVDAYIKIIES